MTAEEYRRRYVDVDTKGKPISEERRISNIQSRSRGEEAEYYINLACEHYKQAGIALIDKTPEPVKILQSLGDGRFIAVFTKKAQPDYKGVIENGKCIHFESKSTANDKILQNVVTPEQTDALNISAKLGADCFVVVYFSSYRRVFRVPWDVWTNMKELYGHKYMNIKDVSNYEIKITSFGFDFLA